MNLLTLFKPKPPYPEPKPATKEQARSLKELEDDTYARLLLLRSYYQKRYVENGSSKRITLKETAVILQYKELKRKL
jgi:hypothetical protein